MDPVGSADPLSKWERLLLASFLALWVIFGCLVEFRSVFLSRRMGDLGCYLRGAWAVRTGQDLYQVVDDNRWHYNYPPTLAILMVPLADPPAGVPGPRFVPYSVSVAVWYLFGLACLFWAVHSLACALERYSAAEHGSVPLPGSRTWWLHRLLPVLACLPPIGHSLMRGQVNTLVLLFFCGSIAGLLTGRSLRAGLFLAGAICIKVYPVFLLVYPLWRRDVRLLAGCALGLTLGLIVIPVAAFGPGRSAEYYSEYFRVTLAPGIGAGEDRSRAHELTKLTSTDSQSLLAAMHNSMHPNRATRPEDAAAALRAIHLLVCVLMTLTTLAAAGWKRPLNGPDVPIFFGALVLVMLLLSPVCHLHYFCLAVPIIMGLLARHGQRPRRGTVGPWMACLLAANAIVNVLPNLPALERLRELCLTTYMALVLWAIAVIVLWKRTGSEPVVGAHRVERPGLAA